MTACTENLAYIEDLAANEEAGEDEVDGETAVAFHVLKCHQDRGYEYSLAQTAMDLPPPASYDLMAIMAPFDGFGEIPDFRTLVDRCEIPSGFVLERARSVTHSFGSSLTKDGVQSVWIQFLCTASSPDVERSEWLRSSVVLKWSTAGDRTPDGRFHCKAPVTLMCFGHVASTIGKRLIRLVRGADWEDVLQDPYLLLDMVYEAWYIHLDDSGWKTNDFCRNIEKDAFRGARHLDASFQGAPVVDLHHVHTIAKNAIFMLEGLEATLRSLDAAIAHHRELPDTHLPIWKATHSTLVHRRELFQATKLRIISVEKRLANIINLAFNIDAMQNSRITQRDSYSLKALSLAATVFLPLSTIATVFSTPFFESSGSSPSPQSGGGKGGGETLLVRRNFWLLWAISVPITVALICGWWLLEKKAQPGSKGRHRPEIDVERG
ncbi:uncharacterized protein GIQ15_04272 [Arthroderma uncinatum]|uniref:uncharacterized protein n=1 Tax=Arthroderma uncinatum TaxID=74035 RepID=UPI00144AEEC1|nr:uncharacterized protein GIQ15_04272 [Arthroderma uncinatum]KAF3481513.1 hypothetical protein GIQ15_04272 [Arthroderma uncinatum]